MTIRHVVGEVIGAVFVILSRLSSLEAVRNVDWFSVFVGQFSWVTWEFDRRYAGRFKFIRYVVVEV